MLMRPSALLTSVLLALVLSCGLVALILEVTSYLSGWAALARTYRHEGSFEGESWRYQSAYMRRLSRYRHCLTIGADHAGLFVSMFWIFRVAHPPLFIPWNQVSRRSRRFLWSKSTELRLGREDSIPFRINPGLSDRLAKAAGESWPAESLE
jgi:hypothetical protein